MKLVLWSGFFIQIGCLAQAAPIEFAEYLQRALKRSEALKLAQLELSQKTVDSLASDKLFRTELALTPFQKNYDLLNPSNLRQQSYKESGFKAGATQFLSTGTELGVLFDSYSDNTRTQEAAQKQSVQLSLTQNLLKNSWGEADRLQKRSLDLKVQATQAQLKATEIRTCQETIKKYIDAWSLQENVNLSQEIQKNSERLLASSRKSRDKGLLSELDWLSIQSDALAVQAQTAQLQSEKRSLFEELKSDTGLSTIDGLASPLNAISESWESLKNNSTNSIELAALELQQQSLDEKISSEKSAEKPELNLIAQYQDTSGDYQSTEFNSRQNYFGLEFKWTFNDGSRNFGSRSAQLELQKTQIDLDLTRKRIQQRLAESQVQIETLSQLTKTTAQRSLILDKMLLQYEKRFLQGRIEFQDFLQIKEQWIENQKQSILYQKQLHFEMTQHLALRGILLPPCGAAL